MWYLRGTLPVTPSRKLREDRKGAAAPGNTVAGKLREGHSCAQG